MKATGEFSKLRRCHTLRAGMARAPKAGQKLLLPSKISRLGLELGVFSRQLENPGFNENNFNNSSGVLLFY
jgi:hypothetical protein